MSRVALEALVGCIFSQGLGDPKAVCDATTRYYATCGGLDPFDILGLPDFVPRFTRLGVRHVLRDFYKALSAAISERRRSLAAEPNAPRDMLGAMLAAKDPQTGQQMSETEVKDNVMTFIFGGQETTSSSLTWAIYLLSQSPEWHERVAREADDMIGGHVLDAVNALIQTRAVVEEALRLYPPVIGITRTALRRTELAGHLSNAAPWLSSHPTWCIDIACFGAIRTCSIRRVSSLDDRRRSSDTPIFLSEWDRACA
jgi:cytochrome P450